MFNLHSTLLIYLMIYSYYNIRQTYIAVEYIDNLYQ